VRAKNWLTTGLSLWGVVGPIAPLMAYPSPPDLSQPMLGQVALSSNQQNHLGNPNGLTDLRSQDCRFVDVLNLEDCLAAADPMAELPTVAALTDFQDIQPNDWAFQALQTLVKRYGMLAGFPDRTFRGNQALTRDQFVAAVNQLMTVVQEQLARGDLMQQREDFATLRRLQENYRRISANLSDRTAQQTQQLDTLEQHQFSPTTRLNGQLVTAFTTGTDAQATILSRSRLNLSTSFSGQDLLRIQLQFGNNGGDAVSLAQNQGLNLLGTGGLLAAGGGADYVGVIQAVDLHRLFYTFPVNKTLNLAVGARLAPQDFIDDNTFANDSATNFSSSFFANNPLTVQNTVDRPGGAGAVLTWQPNSNLALRVLYASANAAQPDRGLVGDPYQSSMELEYSLSAHLVTRFQYTYARNLGTQIHAAGLNLQWQFDHRFGLFSRLGLANYQGFNSALQQHLDWQPWTWSVGTVIRNIIIPGSTAGVAIGQPFVESKLGNATQTNLEAYYSFSVNDNISISPTLMVVRHPNNQLSQGTIWEGLIRVVYLF